MVSHLTDNFVEVIINHHLHMSINEFFTMLIKSIPQIKARCVSCYSELGYSKCHFVSENFSFFSPDLCMCLCLKKKKVSWKTQANSCSAAKINFIDGWPSDFYSSGLCSPHPLGNNSNVLFSHSGPVICWPNHIYFGSLIIHLIMVVVGELPVVLVLFILAI